MRVQTEEEYLSGRGASRQDIGDSALHKLPGVRESNRERLVRAQWAKDSALLARRDRLRLEYRLARALGTVRPPTRRERLESIAAGHPDRADVQAARRLLKRYPPDFEFGEDGDDTWSDPRRRDP